MNQKNENLRELLKQELLNKINERVTPNIIKKKYKNNYQLDDKILKQISDFKKAHGREIEDQREDPNENQKLQVDADQKGTIKRAEQQEVKLLIKKVNKETIYKNAMINEFERIVNDSSIDDEIVNISCCEYLENKDLQISETFKGTKNQDYSKWFFIQEFLKLTKNMGNSEIGKILKMSSDNVRKKKNGFKKVEIYLALLRSCKKNYISLNLPSGYFQKILNVDWNKVLINLNRVVNMINRQ